MTLNVSERERIMMVDLSPVARRVSPASSRITLSWG